MRCLVHHRTTLAALWGLLLSTRTTLLPVVRSFSTASPPARPDDSLRLQATVALSTEGNTVILTRRGATAVAEHVIAPSPARVDVGVPHRRRRRPNSRTSRPTPHQEENININNNNKRHHAYVHFAQNHPFANNVIMATGKSGLADFLAQTLLGGTSLGHLDGSRLALFMLFGALYSGVFQWFYQIRVFAKLFPHVQTFTEQSWASKLRNRRGLATLAGQTALDLAVLTAAYLPAFYLFQAVVHGLLTSTTTAWNDNPLRWIHLGWTHYQAHWVADATDVLRVWLPADLVCFSVPLCWRLPVRHAVSFAWTAYLSLVRGGGH